MIQDPLTPDDPGLQKIAQEFEKARQEMFQIGWLRFFDRRQRRLIGNCCDYARSDPAGMPGHNLALIVAKMSDMLNDSWDDSMEGKWGPKE